MYRKALGLAAILATTMVGTAFAADLPVKAPPKPAPPPPFFFVNENSVSLSYYFTATNPGAGTTPKQVVTFTHFDVWAYGTNFFTIDWLKATNGRTTPAAPCDNPLYGGPQTCPGYTEIYGLFRSTLGWNQLSHSKNFAWGPLTNIEFAWGSDLNTDNTTLGSAKRSIEAGLQFDFAAPYKGFLNVGVYAYKEWQHDGFGAAFPFGFGYNPGGNVSFNTTWDVEALWVQPLGFLPESLPLTFKSFALVHGPKGSGEAGVPQRITEYHTRQTLELDVGKMITGKANMFSMWVAYRWWKNKFGLDPVTTGFVGTTESTGMVGATFAF
jgi:hypothetical protein